MAYARCLAAHSPPRGRTVDYLRYVLPVGYPETALICGIPGCPHAAVIWLSPSEEQQYRDGVRVFAGPNNNFTKMKAADGGLRALGEPG